MHFLSSESNLSRTTSLVLWMLICVLTLAMDPVPTVNPSRPIRDKSSRSLTATVNPLKGSSISPLSKDSASSKISTPNGAPLSILGTNASSIVAFGSLNSSGPIYLGFIPKQNPISVSEYSEFQSRYPP